MPTLSTLLSDIQEAVAEGSLSKRVATLNAIIQAAHNAGPFQREPVGAPQWVPMASVVANDYNPNSVATPEMELLAHSIRSDGYTQPIVTMPDGLKNEVVDGFHRNRVGKEQPDIKARIHGYLPIVRINQERTEQNDRMASTIRHNRARGKHQIDAMSEIVVELARRNWSNERIGKELGMDADEVLRLLQINGLADMFADQEFSAAWQHSGEVDPEALDDTAVDLEWGIIKTTHKPGWHQQTENYHLLYGADGQLRGTVRKSHIVSGKWYWKAYTAPMVEGEAPTLKQGQAAVNTQWSAKGPKATKAKDRKNA